MPTDATIIVTENDTGNRITMCGILEEAGYRVIGLARGGDALEMIRKIPFDAVITDIRLPDAGGLEILRQAREVNPDTAVIIMTGYATVETAIEAVNRGAYAYFVKPVNPDEIKTTLANALKQQRLSLENKRLVQSVQGANQLLVKANEGLHNEIIERRQAEEALRESEARYRGLVNNVRLGIFRSTPGATGRFLAVNPAMEEITGYSREELLQMHVSDIYVHPEERETTLEEITSAKGKVTRELNFRKKKGSEIVVSDTKTAVRGSNGEILYFDGILEDITERKRIEQELIEKTREVVRANQLKSEFLAQMSHELRTPLNVIIGFSELMIDEVPGKINEEQRQSLNDVLDNARRLLDLINDVLDLSRIESGKTELKLGNIALTEVVESLARTMMPILTPREQSLAVEIEDRLPPVLADEAKLKQVLLNLVDNASKFTPDGGKLKIKALREGDYCRVSVIDNGIGLKKEDQERIFDPFCQLDNPLARGERGTGLGLPLVKQIVESYGGQIWLESEYGKGSRFTFSLPLSASS
ncbi:MAG: PAS domain S-box protein [Chloroflexi bacterium]|nr:PAS domain S-box protein [Chloroflexota bacterium]